MEFKSIVADNLSIRYIDDAVVISRNLGIKDRAITLKFIKDSDRVTFLDAYMGKDREGKLISDETEVIKAAEYKLDYALKRAQSILKIVIWKETRETIEKFFTTFK